MRLIIFQQNAETQCQRAYLTTLKKKKQSKTNLEIINIVKEATNY